MTTIQSDYDLLLQRVASGELGAGNLVEMIITERSKNATLQTAVKEWQLLHNELQSWVIVSEWSLHGDQDVADLVELILWLAIPWADNDPFFPESDGWTPAALAANVRMKATWQRVVRGTQSSIESLGAVPTEKGVADGNESIS